MRRSRSSGARPEGPTSDTVRIAVTMTLLAAVSTLSACGSASEEGADLSMSHVHGLAVDGDTLYVATHDGLFVREGERWSRRSEDTADHMGFTFVSRDRMFRSGHPEGGGNLGVQGSTDGGRTWETVSDVLSSPVDFHAMAGGGDPLALYGWSGGLYRAIDDPTSWEPADARGLPDGVGALAVSAATGDVYASTERGLYRSSDEGGTWERASPRVVFALAVPRDEEQLVYASEPRDPGVLRSADGGGTWEDVSEGLEAEETVVALAASADGRTVIAADANGSLWRSEDGGSSWSDVATP